MSKKKYKPNRELQFTFAVAVSIQKSKSENPLDWSYHIKRDFPNEYRNKYYEYLAKNS